MEIAEVITASTLYNLIACEHRLSMDLFADPSERDQVSPFIRMLVGTRGSARGGGHRWCRFALPRFVELHGR